jgi:hypothetical protein
MNENTPRAKIGDIPVWCGFDELAPIENLKPHPNNNTIHPEAQIELLAEVIRDAGFRDRVTISRRSGCITKGHGRLMAAKLLGLTTIPVEYQDYASTGDEVADLTADNQIARYAEFNPLKTMQNIELVKLDAVPLQRLGFLDIDLELKKMLVAAKPRNTASDEKYQGNAALGFEKYEIIIDCGDENTQTELLGEFMERGMKCKAIVV